MPALVSDFEQTVERKLRQVIRSVVHDGVKWDDACELHKAPATAIALKLDKPEVKAMIKREINVRLQRAQLSNVHALERIRDATDTTAAVKAAMVLEEMAGGNVQTAISAVSTPGVTINILSHLPHAAHSGARDDVQSLTIDGSQPVGIVDEGSAEPAESSQESDPQGKP